MVLFRYIRKCYKSVFKKFLIILTCVMLVFASNVKNAKAFFLVDDLTVVAILGGLCALGGVVLTTTSFKDNASEVLTNAVNSYVDYYGGLASDAYEKVKEIATDIYASGTVLASDFNDWLHGWFGDFVNTYVLPNYHFVVEGTTPIFKDFANLYLGTTVVNEYLDFATTGHKTFRDVSLYWVTPQGDVVTSSMFSNIVPIIKDGYVWYLSGQQFVQISKKVCYAFLASNNFSTYSNALSNSYDGSQLVITGTRDLIVYLGAELGYAYYHANSKTWSGGMDGTLELDPGVFDTDILGDIDIAPPYTDGLLDNTLDYTNYWVLGQDLTYDDTGRLTFPGTLEVPKDLPYDKPWDIPGESDYPLVIPGEYPIVNDIPKDDVVDRYPDIPITTTPTYTADWTSVFPFCIPFDIFRFFELLSAKPEAPNFTWEYDILGVKGSLDIDLSTFDEIAQICRNMMDLIFIVGLAMVTRAHLIKA